PQAQHAMSGVAAAVVAVVIAALSRLVRPILRDLMAMTIAALACIAGFVLKRSPQLQPEIVILFSAAIIGALLQHRRQLSRLPMLSTAPAFLELAGVFLKIGDTLFGSGYLLINYLQTDFIDQRHWLTQKQMLDAIAVGQFTPGPVLTTATFVGFLVG